MKKIAISIAILLLCFAFILYFRIKSNVEKRKILNRDYTLIDKKHSINGYIYEKFDYTANKLRDPKYASYVKVGDNKFKIIAKEINGLGINEVISIGDSIYKKCNNDTIYLIKQNNKKQYVFLRKNNIHHI